MLRYLCIACLLLTGCASTGGNEQAATTQPTAQCLVCKKNADLACVDVSVQSDTPRYVYNGQTYYFCSDSCRDEFAKAPQKYLK